MNFFGRLARTARSMPRNLVLFLIGSALQLLLALRIRIPPDSHAAAERFPLECTRGATR